MTSDRSMTSLEMFQNRVEQHRASQRTVPQMLPALSRSSIGGQSQPHAQSQKSLSRPGSAYVLFSGDRAELKKNKSRMSVKGARSRDIQAKTQHSYKPVPHKYQLNKVQDASLASHVKPPVLPGLV